MTNREIAHGAPGQRFLGRRLGTVAAPVMIANPDTRPGTVFVAGVQNLIGGKRGQTWVLDRIDIIGQQGAACDEAIGGGSGLNQTLSLMASTKDGAAADVVRDLFPFYTQGWGGDLHQEPLSNYRIDDFGFVPQTDYRGDRTHIPASLGCAFGTAVPTKADCVSHDCFISARFLSVQEVGNYGIKTGYWGWFHGGALNADPAITKELLPAPQNLTPPVEAGGLANDPALGSATDYWRIHTLIVRAGPARVAGGNNTITIGSGTNPAGVGKTILHLRSAKTDHEGMIDIRLTDIDCPCEEGLSVEVLHAGFGGTPGPVPDTRMSIIVGAELCHDGVGNHTNRTGVPA